MPVLFVSVTVMPVLPPPLVLLLCVMLDISLIPPDVPLVLPIVLLVYLVQLALLQNVLLVM